MQHAAENLLPDSWVETAVKKTMLAFESWMVASNSQPYPGITLDLTPIKTYLQTPQGEQAIQVVMQAIPACTQGLTLGDLFNLAHLTCLPEGIDQALLTPILAAEIASLIRDRVSYFDLNQQGVISRADIAGLQKHSARKENTA